MEEWRADRIGSALRGETPTVMARLPGGFAVIGDVQWLPGYCVLLTDDPTVDRLSSMAGDAQRVYLQSVALLAEEVCARADPLFRRVNIEILGNTDPFLHAHVWPRYTWEPPERIGHPVWLYPPERWSEPDTALGPAHDALRAAIAARLLAEGGESVRPSVSS